ncbi:MAG: hypothetical protein ABL872_03510 [Lacibacter sp.]
MAVSIMVTLTKRYLALLSTTFLPIILLGQPNDSILLRWKIAPNENLKYFIIENQTVIGDSVDNKSNAKVSTQQRTNDTSLNKKAISFKNLFYGPRKSYKGTDTSLLSLLQKKKNIISINIITVGNGLTPLGVDTSTAFAWRRKTPGDTILRGSIYDSGAIESFYTLSSQKNLIALYCQLPDKKLKIGDRWPLEFSYLYFNDGFICDTSFKKNDITLTDIKKRGNETIAVITYDIIEYASGTIGGMFIAKEKVTMKFTYSGVGEFCIEKGRWVSYKATQTTMSDGFIKENSVKNISLLAK